MKNGWYVASESRDLGAKPLAIEVCGDELVLFRGADGQVAALHDRCAHRGVALSRGARVAAAPRPGPSAQDPVAEPNTRDQPLYLQCPYHGWKYDATGRCVEIPANKDGDPIPAGAAIRTYPAVEQDGYIWVWPGEAAPDGQPPRVEHLGEGGWAFIRLQAEVRCPVANVIENFIDNPHTGYIHGGLFRTPASHLTHHHVRTEPDGVVIDIDEEAVSTSLLGRLLLRKGEQVLHQDRYLAPATVQVAYTFGRRQAIGWQFCTPVDDRRTRIFVHVTWSAGWATALLKPFATVVGRKILDQDLAILDHQGEHLERHGTRFCSTAADTANLWIDAYRRRAVSGQAQPDAHDKKVSFRV